uniref:PRELI/MSF1 domain-containing protein n=1 Tax=Ascaris lumbricoides TaxID=6252 RepID=A0A9J2PQA4_ASCLU
MMHFKRTIETGRSDNSDFRVTNNWVCAVFRSTRSLKSLSISLFAFLTFFASRNTMKIWTSEHVFDHPWNMVVSAAWRKYPNPMNKAVTGMDVMKQEVRNGSSLRSERIIQSRFSIPAWVTKDVVIVLLLICAFQLTGFSGTQYSHEVTEIDPTKKTMTLVTRNLNGSHFLRVDEKLTYTPDPDNPQRTILRQEAAVTVSLPAFTDYCEKTFLNVYQCNADKVCFGRKGLEWVIGQYSELSSKVSSGVQDISDNVLGTWNTASAR